VFYTGDDPTQCVAVLLSTRLKAHSHLQWDCHVSFSLRLSFFLRPEDDVRNSYVDNTTAFTNNLSYISDRNTVIMKVDNTSTLNANVNRMRCAMLTFHTPRCTCGQCVPSRLVLP
jgi:hypothetical protein